MLRSIGIGLFFVFAGMAVQAQEGEKVFQTICSKCHRDGAPDAPAPSTLRSLPWQTILTALESGKMTAIGKTLSVEQRDAVAKYLGTAGAEAIPQSAHCSGAAPPTRGQIGALSCASLCSAS